MLQSAWPPGVDASLVSDAMDRHGLSGVVDGIRPLWEGARLAGPVITVRLVEGIAPTDRPPLHLGARAIDRARPGDVIVMANEGRLAMGAWGGLLSRAAALRGVSGVIIDGACRDIDEARELDFPVFGRTGIPRTARGRIFESACGEPVEVGGVQVRTGDWVIADAAGVVFVPFAQAAAVSTTAGELVAREAEIVRLLAAGRPLSEALGARYENMLARPGADGKP
jgi:4-hydroxy-4-methyl-2-oxoglutarate aldolase